MNAVIYARYSSDNQTEESINAQLRACHEYALKNNITVQHEYIDRAFSARSDARPEFLHMISDSKTKGFSAVIVHKLDRFSRDRYDHAIYKKELKKNGVRVLSVLENLDDSPEGVVLESVLEGFSEYYSKNLARETRKGLKEVAEKAKFTGGCPPFGFDVDEDNYYIVNEIEAEAVRQIFQTYLDGTGYSSLIKDFKKRGIKTKFGKPFGKSSFNAILKNEKYIGNYIYYPEGTAREKASEPIVKNGALPSIVDKKTFMEVQQLMSQRKRTGRNKAIEPYLLSGILYCAECGASMSGHRRKKDGKHYYSYECGSNTSKKTCEMRSFSRDKLENLIGTFIKSIMSKGTIEEIKEFLMHNQQELNDNNQNLKTEIKKELSSIDTKINNIIDLLIDTPSEKLKTKLLELEERQKQLEYEYEKCEYSEITEEKINEYIVRVSNFEELSREEKRFYIQKIIKKITAHKDGNLEISTTYNKVVDKDGGATPNTTLLTTYWWMKCILRYEFKI